MSSPSILVVGSLAYDDIRTPTASGERLLGGSASHFSLAASLAGALPRVVAVVGEDFDAADLDMLAALPADLSGVRRLPGPSFRWGGEYSEDLTSRRTLFTELGVFADFQPEIPAELAGSGTVFLANIHPSLQGSVLDALEGPELVALDTMNLWIETTRPELDAVMERCHLLFVNDEEARLLTGQSDLLRAGRELLARGPRALLLKKGEHGVLVFWEDRVYPLPSFPVSGAVDPTGAGDSFAGGVMGHLARAGGLGEDALREAALTGAVMGSLAVEGLGVDGLRGRDSGEAMRRREEFLEILVPPSLRKG